jgi:peptide/nickel transport system permease protein
MAVLAPLLAPHSPSDGDLGDIRPGFVPGPSVDHPLGLDLQGRDELSRLIFGARSSLVIGVLSVTLGGFLGIVVGAVAGAFGGWVDALIMRLMDVMLAIPGLLLAVAVAALLGPSLASTMIAIGVAGIPVVARLLRGAMLSELERDYVLAARAVGVKRRTIVLRHLLPNSVSPVLVAATLALGGAILDAAALAFLGLGPGDPSTPEWGAMLAEGQSALQTSPQLVLLPGLAIALAVLGFNLLGDALRDALDPKLRR